MTGKSTPMPRSDMSKGPNPEVLREVQSSGISEEVKQTSIAFLEKFADASTHLAYVEEDAVHIDIPHFVCLPDQPEGVSVSLTASIGRDIEISLEEFFGAFEGHGATYEEAFDFLEYLQEGSCASLNALFERSRLLLRQFCAAGIPAPNLNPALMSLFNLSGLARTIMWISRCLVRVLRISMLSYGVLCLDMMLFGHPQRVVKIR